MSNEPNPFLEKTDVFLPGENFGVRLASLIVTGSDTVIATCQKRKGSMEDCGHDIDILANRSNDGGRTWDGQRVIFTEEGMCTYLGPLIEDRVTETNYVAFFKIPSSEPKDLEHFGTYAGEDGGFWILKSTDQGQSWSEPVHVKARPNRDGWIGWSNNSVHGIQLAAGPKKGRLVMPAFLYKEGEQGQAPGVRGGLLYSDDHGASWQTGAVLPPGSDEVTVAEIMGGGLYINYRKNPPTIHEAMDEKSAFEHESPDTAYYNGHRWYARSSDYGDSFCEHGQVQEQITPGCHAGLTCYPTDGDDHPNILLFSNPAVFYYRQPPSWNRLRLTVRASYDDGRSWPVAKLVEEGHSAYSDLAVTADKTILCLYEDQLDWPEKEVDAWYNSFSYFRKRRPYTERISIARFNLEWLTGGKKGWPFNIGDAEERPRKRD
jgi:sialidase-1